MEKNIGSLDRTIRIVVGIGLIGLALMGATPWGWVGIIPLGTALMGWCPLYRVLGIHTCAHRGSGAH